MYFYCWPSLSLLTWTFSPGSHAHLVRALAKTVPIFWRIPTRMLCASRVAFARKTTRALFATGGLPRFGGNFGPAAPEL